MLRKIPEGLLTKKRILQATNLSQPFNVDWRSLSWNDLACQWEGSPLIRWVQSLQDTALRSQRNIWWTLAWKPRRRRSAVWLCSASAAQAPPKLQRASTRTSSMNSQIWDSRSHLQLLTKEISLISSWYLKTMGCLMFGTATSSSSRFSLVWFTSI